ncbi:acyl-CoA dehydrogenase family protein [Heyndrickxia acidicola]|uniref:Acyl-CoA/acyl-ACP dehydrogenase n=1 Tax=Heyndrickxia acidicola TaxID=209389 RepID=A0ABU6MFY2_9BACI|nr:acyl-CoA dehydrogenase family protein [Heyndrickxia acidicola]MED1203328.1 acyl-CoA/acyl-ACP dehydrogenase [Heyndrickxia acidicola]
MNLLSIQTLDERLGAIRKLSLPFQERAADNDKTGRFPFENIEELKNSKYTALTVPKEFGGGGISLYELVRLQEAIAVGDGATSLSIGWHMGMMMNLSEERPWEPSLLKEVFDYAVNGAVFNTYATEAQTGSPTRGGKPTTLAKRAGDGWSITGSKTFSTMAPMVDFFVVTATIEETNEIGSFLVPRHAEGVKMEETWDSIAMRSTGSHDIILEQVKVPAHHLAQTSGNRKSSAPGYLLHIPACYLGIAEAAKREAISFAKNYTPNSLSHPIAELPAIQQKIGEMELKLMQARLFLYSVAKQWDEAQGEERNQLVPELSAAKMTVTNLGIEAVDLAMRIVGARSLSEKSPLQRLYRDIRAGLHNPPMDDITLLQLAKREINKL